MTKLPTQILGKPVVFRDSMKGMKTEPVIYGDVSILYGKKYWWEDKHHKYIVEPEDKINENKSEKA